MTEQAAFPFFDEWPPVALPSAHPELVLRWDGDGVAILWAEFRLASWVRDWPTALALALPPGLSEHVRVRVRP